MFNCHICNKEFNSNESLHGHLRIHTDKPKNVQVRLRCCSLLTKREIGVKHLEEHDLNFSKFKCGYCNANLYANKKFCNQTCSAKFNNNKRDYYKTEGFRNKVSTTLSSKKRKKTKIKEIKTTSNKKEKNGRTVYVDKTIMGDYCRLYSMTCYHCKDT
jgi:hypothetical protein